MNHWTYLALAIISEVIATSALKLSDGFSRFWPSTVVVIGYAISFYCLSLILKTLPVGVVYAIWSGAGIALIALIGWIFLDQTLDWPAILGLVLIVAGVVVINLFSRSVSH
jgi:small multidrug resistance pump